MSDQLFGFTAEQVERLKRAIDAFEGRGEPSTRNSGRRPLYPSRIIIGALTSAIQPTTGLLTTPKVGTLNVYSFSSTGVEDTGLDETVYNFAPQICSTDRWTVAERDDQTGKFVVTTQFCS